MPRIPGTPLAESQPAGPAVSPFALVRTGRQASGLLREAAGVVEQQRMRRLRALTESKVVEIRKIAHDLALEMEQEDPFDAPRLFGERFEEQVAQVFEDVRDAEARAFLDAKAAAISESTRFSVAKRSLSRQRQLDLELIDQGLAQAAQSFALAETDSDRLTILQDGLRLIQGSEVLDEDVKKDLAQKVPIRFARSRAAYLVRQAREQPGRASEFLAELQELSVTQSLSLPESERLVLRQTFDQESARIEALQRERERERRHARISDLLRRFYDPEHPLGLPTVQDITTSDLAPTLQKSLLEKLKRMSEEGVTKEVETTDPVLYNDLYLRIYDRSRSDRINAFEELLPFSGEGIKAEDMEKLRVHLARARMSPRETRRLNDFLKLAHAKIAPRTLLGPPNAAHEARFFEFTVEVDRLMEEGIREGKNPLDLLDPNNPDYIGKILNNPAFQATINEQLESILSLPFAEGAGQSLVVPQVSPPESLGRRREGETAEEWERRVLQ